MARFNPYFFREIEDPAAADFLEEVSFAVCRYYNWAVMRGYRVPPWSEDQETFAAWLSDNGITVPEVLEGTDLGRPRPRWKPVPTCTRRRAIRQRWIF